MDAERREEIMDAVFAALCTHGYAQVTMQDIADESSLSKGALHYHFDTKRDLLLSFLEHLYERFADRLDEAEANASPAPVDRLEALIDATLHPPRFADSRGFRTAVLEIKAQAPYEPAYRDHLAAFDETLSDRIERIVAEGVAEGRFTADTDPAEVASFVVTVINGAHTRSVATDHPVEAVRSTLREYVDTHLREPGARR